MGGIVLVWGHLLYLSFVEGHLLRQRKMIRAEDRRSNKRPAPRLPRSNAILPSLFAEGIRTGESMLVYPCGRREKFIEIERFG
jgi:hypothetical protein